MNHGKLRDDDAEKAVIGSLLLDPRRADEVCRILRPEHFFDVLYRACFEAAMELHQRRAMIEPIQVLRSVKARRDVPMSQDAAERIAEAGIFVDHVTFSTVTGAHAAYYARIVAQTGLRRAISHKAAQLHESSETERDDVFQAMLAMEAELGRLDGDAAGLKTLSDECTRYLDRLTTDSQGLVSLGLPGLDDAIGGGAEYGEMLVMAARPGHGKTMCAMQILEHAAECGIPGLIVSEEMSSQLLAGRSLLHATAVPHDWWRKRMAEVIDDSERYFAGRSRIQIADPCGTVKAAIAQIDRAVDSGARIVAVDYAQLLKGKGANRYEQVTNVSIELKQACTRHSILMILLCQLSRPAKERKSHMDQGQARGVMPTMTDLRDSGQLEQDADVIVFLQWPVKNNPTYKPFDRYFLYVAKNRNRPTNATEVECKIIPSRQILVPANYVAAFDEWSTEQYEDEYTTGY